MEKTRSVPSSDIFQIAEALDEMALEGSSTLVRDESSTSDDLLETLPAVKNLAQCEGHIRQSLGVVGYRINSRLDNHENRHLFLARRLATGENVAIKVLIELPRDTSSAIKRFHQEARLLASLSHPNLIKAIAHGSLSHVHYLVLDLAPGVNLRKKVANDGPLPVRLAASVVWQAAQALGRAHRHGVIHRDVKPSNLVLGPDGRVKLVDLGLARLPCSPQDSLTMIHHDQLFA